MDIPEYTRRMEKAIRDISSNDDGEIMVKVAISAFTLLRQRVQETGVDAKGSKYKPYSTKPLLIGSSSFLQKNAASSVLGSKEKRRNLDWRTVNGHKLAILPGGYKQLRELQGRQTDHVDFSVTNEMWNDIMSRVPKKSDLLSTDSEHSAGIAIIGAKQEKQKKKLQGNTARRGDILDVNSKEIEDLKNAYVIGELQVFKNNGL